MNTYEHEHEQIIEAQPAAAEGQASSKVIARGRMAEIYATWFDLPVLPLAGKVPRTEHGVKDATTDEELVQAWWRKWPDANIGVAVPPEYIVFDVDPRDGGQLEALGDLPATVMARSGSGGWHVWFRLPEGMRPEALHGGKALAGVDIRKHGNYVVMPPSIHQSGGRYDWCAGCGFEDRDDWVPAPIPDHLLKLVLKPERPELASRQATPPHQVAVAGNAGTPHAGWLAKAIARAWTDEDGGRNHTGFWLACQLRDDGIDEGGAETTMLAYQAAVADRGTPSYTRDEVLKSLCSAYDTPRREPAQSARTGSAASPSSPTCGPQQQQQAGGGNTFAAGGDKARTEVRDSGSAESDSCAAKNPASADSFIPFYSIHSGKTDTVWAERFPDLMETMRQIDALPADGPITYRGSPANERRRQQYALLREAWELIFPVDPLRQPAMSTWLNRAAESAPGMEGELVLDALDGFYHAPHDGPVRFPRAAFTTALLNDLDPEGKAERRAKKDANRAGYKKAMKPMMEMRDKKTSAPEASTSLPAANTPKSDDARREALKAECRRLGLDYYKISHWDDGMPRALYDVEKRVQQFAKAQAQRERVP